MKKLIMCSCLLLLALSVFAVNIDSLKVEADKGNDKAQVQLGKTYLNGYGTAKDTTKAIGYYRMALVKNNPEAQNLIGFFLVYGYSLKKDIPEGLRLIQLSAKNGDAWGLYNLAYIYHQGVYLEKDYVKALELYNLSALQEIVYAQAMLGNMHYSGLGTAVNKIEAAKWYEKAAKNGNLESMKSLYSMYSRGDGVSLDHVKARLYLLQAADAGDEASLLNVALMYLNGYGVAVDTEMAKQYFSKILDIPNGYNKQGAEKGDKLAQFQYALILYNSRKNDSLAYYYMEQSAKQNYDQAQYYLGSLYLMGSETLKQDYSKAFGWFVSSANLGNAMAQNNLATMYATGQGAEVNLKLAAYWCGLSYNNGNQAAAQLWNAYKLWLYK